MLLPWRGRPDPAFALIEEKAAEDETEPASSSPLPKTFQKRRVSSAAAVATVRPSGLVAMCRTRAPCEPAPLVAAALAAAPEEEAPPAPATPTVATRVRLGYFQIASPFEGALGADEKPCADSSSRDPSASGAQVREVTCAPASTDDRAAPVCAFQVRMLRSAAPPPVASTAGWKGHHARALTAARWSVNLCLGRIRGTPPVEAEAAEDIEEREEGSQTQTTLSFPPEAKYLPDRSQARPHTSAEWPLSDSDAVTCSLALTSWLRIRESRPPEVRVEPDHAREATRAAWPLRDRSWRPAEASHSWTSCARPAPARATPTATWRPSPAHDTEET